MGGVSHSRDTPVSLYGRPRTFGVRIWYEVHGPFGVKGWVHQNSDEGSGRPENGYRQEDSHWTLCTSGPPPVVFQQTSLISTPNLTPDPKGVPVCTSGRITPYPVPIFVFP